MALVGVIGQVGCLTLLIISVALITGLWLDKDLLACNPVYAVQSALLGLCIYDIRISGFGRRLVAIATEYHKPFSICDALTNIGA